MQKKRVSVVGMLVCGLALEVLLARDMAGGNRTLMTSRPGDFKSFTYLDWLSRLIHTAMVAHRTGDIDTLI